MQLNDRQKNMAVFVLIIVTGILIGYLNGYINQNQIETIIFLMIVSLVMIVESYIIIFYLIHQRSEMKKGK